MKLQESQAWILAAPLNCVESTAPADARATDFRLGLFTSPTVVEGRDLDEALGRISSQLAF